MKLSVNGQETELDAAEGLSVSELLVEREVRMPDMVSVELNGEILKRGNFDSTTLREGDKVEFLYFMGGGQWS